MSKFVEAMDAFVRLVVITVFTTGALQFSGVVQNPTTVSAYPQFEVKDIHLHRMTREEHVKPLAKQQEANTSSIIDDIFNIPIATLHAVNTLVQNSQPTIQRIREMAQQRRANKQIAIAEGQYIPKRQRKHYRVANVYSRTTEKNEREQKEDVKNVQEEGDVIKVELGDPSL